MVQQCALFRDGSGGQCRQVVSSDLGVGGGHDVDAAAGEDVESEVVPSFGPFVGLLGQGGPDKAHDRGTVGEDPHGVGSRA